MCEDTRKFVECYPVIGLHPAEFDRLYNKGRKEVCYKILDTVESYYKEGKVVGIGEFGRPHYPVSSETMAEAHLYMVEALKRAHTLDCPIQLHTESLDDSGIEELDALVEKIQVKKAIKHFSPPSLTKYTVMIPSVLATESNIEKALKSGKNFLMETDYIDDPRRPGAVLGPKTVPRTTKNLMRKGILTEDIFARYEDVIKRLYNLE